MVVTLRLRLTSLIFVVLLEWRVPSRTCACVLRNSGHSDCKESHAALLVNEERALQASISAVVVLRMMDS